MEEWLVGHFQFRCQQRKDLTGDFFEQVSSPGHSWVVSSEASCATPAMRLTPASAVQSRAQPSSSSARFEQFPACFQSLAQLLMHLPFQVTVLQATMKGAFHTELCWHQTHHLGNFQDLNANVQDFHAIQNKGKTVDRLAKIRQQNLWRLLQTDRPLLAK